MKRTTLLGALLLAVTLAPAASAQQGPYPPPAYGSAEVSPSRLRAGGCATFSGDGFGSGGTVRLADDGADRGTAPLDADGRFRTQVCFSASARVGDHVLSAAGTRAGSGDLTVSARITITGIEESAVVSGANGGRLAHTGIPVAAVVLLGTLLVAVGSALVLLAEKRHRRRRRLRARAA